MSGHLKAVAKLSVAAAVATTSQIIKGKIAATILGPTGVGTFSQLKYLFNLMQAILGLGFYGGLVRNVAHASAHNDEPKIREQISTVLLTSGLIACLGSTVAAATATKISSFLFSGDEAHAPLVFLIIFSVPCAIIARMYKGILSAFRDVRRIVICQVTADTISVGILAYCVNKHGLYGAVLSFCLYQLLRGTLFSTVALSAYGGSRLFPRLSNLKLEVLRKNASFSAASLVLAPVSILTTLLVSRTIIKYNGLSANGIYAAAWIVSSVYLRVLYESASSYFVPVLASAKTDEEFRSQIDSALRLYHIGLPPVVIGLVGFGEFCIETMFSAEFTDSGRLLLWLLPVDLIRVVTETLGLAMTARVHLLANTSTYILWAVLYTTLATLAVPEFGLLGAVWAYGISHAIYCAAQIAIVHHLYGYLPNSGTIRIIGQGFFLSVTASILSGFWPSIPARIGILILCLGLWFALSYREPELKQVSAAVWKKLGIS